ncbi:HEAT repeat domain-containing protein [Roseofilum capinflatum]|uniref:HEAT repeat domain-containing protein n=1 Tax=Roseofilum capinflatum BLCC-M114 TaxID=3022440 RepID=A0ABT7BAL3_9CYAN|nr:HEAT repeat domain-containing protein [Roseofilum capinflatum]MDJ1175343.1 HEAT repeat domain-containing protein [Roseofilum capinflatum BLCC-M114]
MTTSVSSLSSLLEAIEKADSSDRLIDAVEDLAAAQIPESAPTLIQVLSYNNPGAAVAAVDGLIALGDLAVNDLLQLLDNYNYGGRAWAIRALAGIGHPDALETLLEAATTDFSMSVRRGAARGLGTIQWSKLPSTEVSAAQERVMKTLFQVTEDPEWVVRYAAVVGLGSLGESVDPSLYPKIIDRLQQLQDLEEEPSVRARIQWAIQGVKQKKSDRP